MEDRCSNSFFSPAVLINAHNRTLFPEKICLKAAGWERLKDESRQQPLELIFFCAFLPPVFCAKKGACQRR